MEDCEHTEHLSADLGKCLFTLAVIADTHLNQADMVSSSPFKVNRLANGRMRFVVHSLNARKPDFVINLGDLIHPVPALPAYAEAAQRFLEQTAALTCRQYLVPGNHDVGDKPIKWGPAGVVRDEYLALWEKYFGEHYYAFGHKGCHFVVINAQIINSGLASEEEQRIWLERDLDENHGTRIFINIHYPPYLAHPDEPEHYDNIAEPGRSWLLKLLLDYNVEALFAGHVHNFWYYRHGATDCYLLPSTAFVRQDYSEMYDIGPGDEYGRNDSPKLGYFLVHVHERGHVCHPVRTYGAVAEEISQPPDFAATVRPLHPIENRRAPLGFSLRHAWAAFREIPPSGALDEFSRKTVRNDYPLLALWEMGVRKLRVPLQDLADEHTRARMRDLVRMGHEFTVYSFEIPSGSLHTALIEHRDLVSAWEMTVAQQDLRRFVPQLRAIKEACGIPVFLSRLRLKDDLEKEGLKYYHVINHGFIAAEADDIVAMLSLPEVRTVIDGLVFRVARQTPPWQQILAIGQLVQSIGLRASIHLRLAGDSPADAQQDDRANANRLAEALCAAMTQPFVSVFADTLVDVDRGFFPRNGVLDRRCNPKIGSRVIRHLYGALSAFPEPLAPVVMRQINGGWCAVLKGQSTVYALLMPDGAINADLTAILAGNLPSTTVVTATDLDTGAITTIVGSRVKQSGPGKQTTRVPTFTNPTLLAASVSGANASEDIAILSATPGESVGSNQSR